jgi:crotonobetainyl-CoA:carnitine CoA-transferase CaiB-like acyl-CoA transferase
MPGALEGVRVVDFGQYIAGPMAAMLLGDQGADVIRVDPSGGPRFISPANATWNRGKRSIVLDLKDPTDLSTARDLIARADVVVENFRPGVADRLGIGPAAALDANPRVIYLSLPGFGADDARAPIAAWEGVIGAATSLYTRPSEPVFTPIPISSCYGAFLGAGAVAMALNVVAGGGPGQRIEVPLHDATFTAIGYRAQRRVDAPPASGLAPAGPQTVWFGAHRTKDERWVYFHIGNKNAIDLITAAGAADWWDAPDAPERVAALFATRTAQEWEDLGAAVHTEMAVCTTSAEWLQHPHARGSEMIVEVKDPHYGAMLQPGLAVRLARTPGHIAGPAHELDEDRAQVRSELLAPSAPIGAAIPAGGAPLAALAGIRVLDLCIVLAGPTCARTLAEYGAEVTKIDGPPRTSLGGGGDNQIMQAFNIEVNRGKRSIVLDLTTAEGKEIFWSMVDDADVVVENYRSGVVDQLGIGYEQVRARKPDIIYASLNAYGYQGPWADRPGHEQMGQSVTGMSLRFGGDGEPVLQSVALNDFGTGLLGAYGIGLALLHKQRTGEGQWVNGSLAQTACLLQSLFLQDYDGKVWDEPRGQDARGFGPLQRIYRAQDGWFFLGAAPEQQSDLGRVLGIELTGEATADALSAAFADRSADDCVALLIAAGIGAHRLATLPSMMDAPRAIANGLSITRDHAGFGPVQTSGPAPRLSVTPMAPGRPAPVYGADTLAILADLGIAGAQAQDLLARGVVRQPAHL